MEIRKLGTQIGAEITGVDVKTLNDEAFSDIYRAWLDYNVICVRGQQLELADFVNYSRRFGNIITHPSKSTRFPGFPEITVLGVNKFDENGNLRREIYARGGEGFHTDGSYEKIPYKATQLYALAIPTTGGDTLFASTYASYEAMPPQLRQRSEKLSAAYVYGGRKKQHLKLLDKQDRDGPPAVHPLVRVHPETGRKALYFDYNKVLRIEGLPEAESDALIDELRGYMLQPDAQYRHKWRKGDIVIWDNRCSYHKAAADYPPEQDRIHWRVSILEHGQAREDNDAAAYAM